MRIFRKYTRVMHNMIKFKEMTNMPSADDGFYITNIVLAYYTRMYRLDNILVNIII